MVDMELYFVTGNKNKLQEFEEILGFKLKSVKAELDEIQAIDVKKVVKHKTKQVYKLIKKPVITEDTGLYFDEWNGLPGALIKWFGQAVGYDKVPQLLKNNRKAKAQTVIGYFDGRAYKEFVGEISGKISIKAKGKTNFGWDIIFIPDGHRKTFGQMSAEEKNQISMRKIAVEKLKRFLRK
jgi:XTP/dITP diphosphohydrolase